MKAINILKLFVNVVVIAVAFSMLKQASTFQDGLLVLVVVAACLWAADAWNEVFGLLKEKANLK